MGYGHQQTVLQVGCERVLGEAVRELLFHYRFKDDREAQQVAKMLLTTRDPGLRDLAVEKVGKRAFSIFEREFERRRKLKSLRQTLLVGGDIHTAPEPLILERRMSLPTLVAVDHLTDGARSNRAFASPVSKAKEGYLETSQNLSLCDASDAASATDAFGLTPVSTKGIGLPKESKKQRKIEILKERIARTEQVWSPARASGSGAPGQSHRRNPQSATSQGVGGATRATKPSARLLKPAHFSRRLLCRGIQTRLQKTPAGI